MNCNRCRFWDRSTPDRDRPKWGVCTLTVNMYDTDNPPQKTLAIAKDAEDYFAKLLTAPSFGCVQFKEAKEVDRE